MGIGNLLLGALAVLPGQAAPETKPELLQFAQLARLPLEPVESPLGRSVFVVAKRSTSGSTFVAAVDGTTGERRWKFEAEGRPAAHGSLHAIQSSRGARLLVRRARGDLLAPQNWIVLDANDGKFLRELTLPASETCVALDVDPDGMGSCTTIDLAGYFHRRDLRTGDERAQGGWYCDGLVAQGVQIPDETRDGVPELVSLAADNQGLSLHAFDGVTLERRRSAHLKRQFKEFEKNVEFLGPELQVITTSLGVRLRVSEWGFHESRHALLDLAFDAICAHSAPEVSRVIILNGSSLARLQAEIATEGFLRVRFYPLCRDTPDKPLLGEVRVPRSSFPWPPEQWMTRMELQHGDSTLWITFPNGSKNGDEPVLAAWDIATGREVWRSENLLR